MVNYNDTFAVYKRFGCSSSSQTRRKVEERYSRRMKGISVNDTGLIVSRLPFQPEHSGMIDEALKECRRTCLVWTSPPTYFHP